VPIDLGVPCANIYSVHTANRFFRKRKAIGCVQQYASSSRRAKRYGYETTGAQTKASIPHANSAKR